MGQKTHPYGFRLVYNKGWHSRWYADKDYSKILESDIELRPVMVVDGDDVLATPSELEGASVSATIVGEANAPPQPPRNSATSCAAMSNSAARAQQTTSSRI